MPSMSLHTQVQSQVQSLEYRVSRTESQIQSLKYSARYGADRQAGRQDRQRAIIFHSKTIGKKPDSKQHRANRIQDRLGLPSLQLTQQTRKGEPKVQNTRHREIPYITLLSFTWVYRGLYGKLCQTWSCTPLFIATSCSS